MRYEKKFKVAKSDFPLFSGLMIKLKYKKQYQSRFISSIYYDTINFNLYKDSINGVSNRKKYRVRFYNDNLEEINIEEKIRFLGKILKPYDLIAGADYFILPSRYEGLPNCVLESLALGTPVISTKQIFALNDFKKNISNKSIMLFESINEISKKIDSLEKRKDYKKPKLRKSLLIDYISPINFNKTNNQ